MSRAWPPPHEEAVLETTVRAAMLASLALLALVVTGCSGSVDGPVLTSQPQLVDRGDNAAEVRGTVELDGDYLLLVSDDAPGVPGYPVVWSSGTRWQPDPPAVVLADGTVVALGERVGGGGGYVQPDDPPPGTGADVVAGAAACVGDTGEVAFINPGSQVTAPGD